jgi:hypothetical protein
MKKLLIVSGLIVSCFSLRADNAVFQASLTPDLAIYPRDTDIHGLLLNFIWGENRQTGLALGLVNGSIGESEGVSLGFVNYDESYRGFQMGLVNLSRDNFIGWQHGLVNISGGKFKGFQEGIVNVSERVKGLQLGVANFADNLHGVQLGLINVAQNNPWFGEAPHKLAPVFPFFNWSF